MNHFFYVCESQEPAGPEPAIGSGYESCFWRPSLTSIVPRGLPRLRFGTWWLVHYARLFANREYCLFVVRYGGVIIHRTGVFPRYFSFPFMGQDDLQIGAVWTAAEHRGKGIAPFAIRAVLRNLAKRGRRFWYVTDAGNAASIRAAEKAGFKKIAEGRKHARFGLRALGFYDLKT